MRTQRHDPFFFPLAADPQRLAGEIHVIEFQPHQLAHVVTLREALVGNEVSRVYGILNGTCNYILSTMEQTGRDFGEVLAEAQALGYAETDPTFDVEGVDAAHKLAILAAIAFGTRLDFAAVERRGIDCVRAADIAQASALGFAGGVLGVAIGVVASWAVPKLTDTRMILSLEASAAAIAMAIGIGVVFGVYPGPLFDVARDAGIPCLPGVFAAVPGPSLETRAEYRMLRALGADVVGMSTVPEVIAAVHAGMRVLGLSIITDACLPDALQPTTLEEIVATARAAEPKLGEIVKGVLGRL